MLEEENQELEVVGENTLVKFRQKTSKITNKQKVLLKDIPMESENNDYGNKTNQGFSKIYKSKLLKLSEYFLSIVLNSIIL